ncbi:mechanosensitive ion channel domain-containing protein [uncultured Roseibium sp.]|uniref:mechanosensitive ion channel domain-containing protein n=1 Tax=uncultured Roseibium sp. TaxID=1936171 RepID=UPI0026117F3D|nr:mechanosensitive ion channel domain-containing protein [uncultured Roseibium sp.]
MRILGNILVVILGLMVLGETSALAQEAPSQQASEQTSQTADVQKANDALIKVLNDPASREALIKMLKESASEEGVGGDSKAQAGEGQATGDTTSGDEESAGRGFVIRVGEYTKTIADEIGVVVDRSVHSLKGLLLIFSGEIPIKWDRAKDVLTQVAVVLGAAYLAFWAGQAIARLIYPKLSVRARYGGGLTRSFILVLTSIIDGLTVAVGLGVGYLVALLAYGGFQAGVSLQESLALNAFFITGMANVSLRFVFAPQRPELRLLPFSNASADYWYVKLRYYMFWVNYGVFLAVPVANIAVSFVLGNALRFLIVLIGMLYLMVLIARNRLNVRKGTRDYAQTLHSGLAQSALTNLGNLWHVGAYGYIIAIFLVWVTRPFDATTIILRATGLSIITIMAGMAISLVMTRAIKGGIRIPNELSEKLPALQSRLNAFVPRLLKLIRTIVFIGTILLLFDIWGLLSVIDWIYSETGARLVSSYGAAFMVLIVAFVVWLAVMSWVDLRLQSRAGYIVTARERTLFQLFRNAFTVVIIVMAILLSLSEIGVDIGPLIAGAGVVGLAISFGAQTLVKDIITGAFIQIENAINEGDVVTVAGITGTVEGITVRSVRMRDLDGTTHIIPFSSVDMVSNFMRGFSYHVALIGVSYDTDITYAKDAMAEAFRRLNDTDFKSSIFGDLEMHGVTNFGASSIDIRARIKTRPGDQWSVGRAYNEFVKQVFDERDIEIPFPQVTYHAATPPYATDAGKAKEKVKTGSRKSKPVDDAPADDGEH